mmetsp:Transcript_42210/g.42787  ORF Transcript_42210/g.42787 Transcript_42210/m.42787 type:complete len:88 (+) Transcript_42210:682-945(+)
MPFDPKPLVEYFISLKTSPSSSFLLAVQYKLGFGEDNCRKKSISSLVLLSIRVIDVATSNKRDPFSLTFPIQLTKWLTSNFGKVVFV